MDPQCLVPSMPIRRILVPYSFNVVEPIVKMVRYAKCRRCTVSRCILVCHEGVGTSTRGPYISTRPKWKLFQFQDMLRVVSVIRCSIIDCSFPKLSFEMSKRNHSFRRISDSFNALTLDAIREKRMRDSLADATSLIKTYRKVFPPVKNAPSRS